MRIAREAFITTSRNRREVISDCICEDVAATVAKLRNLTRALFRECLDRKSVV